MKHRLKLGLVPFALLFSAAGTWEPAAPEYTVIDNGAEPLRAAFNADVGKVRVLMLVAPT